MAFLQNITCIARMAAFCGETYNEASITYEHAYGCTWCKYYIYAWSPECLYRVTNFLFKKWIEKLNKQGVFPRVLIPSFPQVFHNRFFLVAVGFFPSGSFSSYDFVVLLYQTKAYNLQHALASCHPQQMDLSVLLPRREHVHQALRVWHPFPKQNVKTAVCEGLLHLY